MTVPATAGRSLPRSRPVQGPSASAETAGRSAPIRPLPLMSVDDVAEYLGVSPRWVYAQVRSGRLPAMFIARSWRIRPEAVDEFADSFHLPFDSGC